MGGGGLIGGIAAWYAGRAKIIGVEPEAAPTLTRAFAAGRPLDARRMGEMALPAGVSGRTPMGSR